MKLLAVLSLFLAAVMASPVAPSAASAVPAAEVVPRNETLEAELAERQLVINYQQVYMVNCWNYGVQQSWLFYWPESPTVNQGYPPDKDRCLVTYGSYKQWGGLGMCNGRVGAGQIFRLHRFLLDFQIDPNIHSPRTGSLKDPILVPLAPQGLVTTHPSYHVRIFHASSGLGFTARGSPAAVAFHTSHVLSHSLRLRNTASRNIDSDITQHTQKIQTCPCASVYRTQETGVPSWAKPWV
ncbi:hypothetical protein VTJ04DRAFT_7428 [Mycothermus thermophilus]|uniref:uncharacterized protein n=1 Tax=Humicola insolens TaxID=85995 RepID=UPI00374462F8